MWRWYLAAGLAAALLLYGTAYLWLSGQQPLALPEYQQTDSTPEPAPRPAITIDESQNPRWVKSLDKSSLADSEVDRVQITTDENGELILVPGIIVYFDYFLSLRGEMAMQRIKQIIWDDIHANFSPTIAARLYDLFERYLAYSNAIDERLEGLTYQQVQAQGLTGQQIEQSLQPDYFTDEEIDGLFTAYHDMLDYTPKASTFKKKYRQYKNTPEEYRFAMATELFGAEAAGRLQALKQRREKWQQRLESYYLQKQQILSSPNLDKQGKEQAVQALLERNFNKHEQVRVGVWEKHLRKPNTKEQK